MDILTYQTAICSLTRYQRYSFTPDQFEKKNFAYVRLVRRAAFIYTYFSKKFACGKLGDFSSKKCKLSFSVQYIFKTLSNIPKIERVECIQIRSLSDIADRPYLHCLWS